MKKLQLILVLIGVSFLSLGRITAQVDSAFVPDSTAVLQFLHQADQMNNADSTRYFLESAFNLSLQLKYENGVHRSLQELSSFEESQGNLSMALRYAWEIMSRLEKEENSQELFQVYLHIGSIYQNEKLYKKAKDYYQKGLRLIGRQTSLTDEIKLFELLANNHFQLNELDTALVYYQDLIRIYTTGNNNQKLIETYQNIITLHGSNNEFQKALDYNFKILELLDETDRAQLAILYNNIGYNYNFLKEYREAIEYFTRTEKLCKESPYVSLPVLFTNIGITYNNGGQQDKAVQYLRKASDLIRAQSGKGSELAYVDNLLATIYLTNGDLYNALRYNDGSMQMVSDGRDDPLLSETYNTAAQIHQELYEYEKALDYLKKYLLLRDSFLLNERIRQQDLLQQQLSLERAEKEIKVMMVQQDMQNLTINQLELEKDKLKLESQNLKLESKTRDDELALLKREQEIKNANLKNKELETERARQNVKLIEQRLEAEKKDRALLILRQEEEVKRLAQLNLERDNALLTKDKDILTKDKALLIEKQEVNRLELEQQRAFRQFVYYLGGLLFLILTMILSGLFYFRSANRRLAEKNNQIQQQKKEIEKSHTEVEEQRHKSEELLLNILPEETVAELKEKGVATPRDYEKVTVLFTDFTGFTEIAESMTPQELITELNICFRAFDEILEKHDLEKIKTLGDGYMCAGGIPVPNDSNPTDTVAAAIEMNEYILQRRGQKMADKIPYWNMRIGIHTGHVVAGVVGKKRFAYDIWGDTVNLASRMESSCADGKINISETTYHLVKHQFNCENRGAIKVKHKGEMDMFFVIDKK